MKYNLCISCNEEENYYEKINDNNKDDFIDCYKDPKINYYLDKKKDKFNPCYPSYKYCYNKSEDKQHHLCMTCNEENSYLIVDEKNPYSFNCFPECKFNYYFNKNHDYICTNTSSCPLSYPLLLENTKQCIESCEKDYYLFRHSCFLEHPKESKNCTKIGEIFFCNASCPFERPFEMNETQYCVSSCTIMERYYKLCFTNYDGDRKSEVQDMVLNDFKSDIIDTFDYTKINEDHNIFHKEKNVIYEITSTKCTYQDPNITTIDLGECEFILKDYYGIDINDALYIFKVDAFVEGKTGPKVEYEIYYPSDGINLRLLDISICEGKEIFIGYPLNIRKEELDLYNRNSQYYTDICYTYTNSKGTDMTLYDRKSDFVNNNKNFCEENCEFSGYDEGKRRLICSCEIKYSISMISEVKIDKNKLYKFINIKQIANFSVMKCFKLFFSIKDIQSNIGFYYFFLTIIVYIITSFVFYLKEFQRIMRQIDEIIAVKKLIRFSWENQKKKKNYLNYLSCFYGFIDKKKIKALNIKEDNLKQKQNIENDKDIKIISNKNKKEIVKFSLHSSKKKEIDNDKDSKEETNIKINESKEKSQSIMIPSLFKKNKFLSKKYRIKNIKKFLKEHKNQENKPNERKLFKAQHIFEINRVNIDALAKKEKIKIVEVLKYNDAQLNDLGYKNAFKYDYRNIY